MFVDFADFASLWIWDSFLGKKTDIFQLTLCHFQGGAWQHFGPLAPLISAKVSRTAAIRTPKATISSLARRSYLG
jgi:hypothetical protein